MKSVIEVYNDSILAETIEYLTEAFQSSIMRQIDIDIKNCTEFKGEEYDWNTRSYVDRSNEIREKHSFKKLLSRFWGLDCKWDQVKDSDFIKLESLTTEQNTVNLRLYRALKAGKSSFIGAKSRIDIDPKSVVFGFLGGELYFISYPLGGNFITFSHGKGYSSHGNAKAKELESMFTTASDLYVLGISGILSSEQDRIQRRKSRAGMIADLSHDDHHTIHKEKGVLGVSAGGMKVSSWGQTDGVGDYYNQCIQLARRQYENYKKLAAQARAKKGPKELDEINDIMDRVFQRYMKASRNFSKQIANTSVSTSDLSMMMNLMSDREVHEYSSNGRRTNTIWKYGIVHYYQRYLDLNANLARNYSYNAATDEKELEQIYRAIKALATTLEVYFKKFDA